MTDCERCAKREPTLRAMVENIGLLQKLNERRAELMKELLESAVLYVIVRERKPSSVVDWDGVSPRAYVEDPRRRSYIGPDRRHAYTAHLQYARTFASKAEAEAELDPGQPERVIPIQDAMPRPIKAGVP